MEEGATEEPNFVFSDEEAKDSVELLTEMLNPKKEKKKKRKNRKKKHVMKVAKPKPVDIEEPHPKKIIRSKKHIDKMIRRLTAPAKPKPSPEDEDLVRKRKPADPKTFDRLYEMSKQKEQKNLELQKQYHDEEMQACTNFTKKSSQRSKELVDEQYSRFLCSIFTGKEQMEEVELIDALRLLGLLSPKQDLLSISVVAEESEKWKKEGDVFDVSLIRESLNNVMATSEKLTPFQSFARQQMMILLANGGKLAKKVEAPVEVQIVRQMHKDTFDRLTKVRESEISKKPAAAKKRPTFVPKVFIDGHIPDVQLTSEGTKEILLNSEIAQLPLEERERALAERREQRIKRMVDEVRQSAPKQTKPLRMPELSEEMKLKLEERKERMKNKPPEGPSFKPKITKYEDFLKTRETMFANAKHPEGWDEDITRRRQAYEQHLKKKEEEEQGIDLLRLRASLRKTSNPVP